MRLPAANLQSAAPVGEHHSYNAEAMVHLLFDGCTENVRPLWFDRLGTQRRTSGMVARAMLGSAFGKAGRKHAEGQDWALFLGRQEYNGSKDLCWSLQLTPELVATWHKLKSKVNLAYAQLL